mgnify:CR=1 FL=1
MSEYKYIEEQVKIRENYKSNIINLEEGIDKLIELGYSYEEAEEFLTKTTEEMLAWVDIMKWI